MRYVTDHVRIQSRIIRTATWTIHCRGKKHGVCRLKFTVSLKKSREFRRLYAKGKSAADSLLVVYFRKNGLCENRVGFTVTTKLGKAVVRNRVRRRLREVYRLNEEKLKFGLDIIIVARVKSRYVCYGELDKAFLDLCRRLSLLST